MPPSSSSSTLHHGVSPHHVMNDSETHRPVNGHLPAASSSSPSGSSPYSFPRSPSLAELIASPHLQSLITGIITIFWCIVDVFLPVELRSNLPPVSSSSQPLSTTLVHHLNDKTVVFQPSFQQHAGQSTQHDASEHSDTSLPPSIPPSSTSSSTPASPQEHTRLLSTQPAPANPIHHEATPATPSLHASSIVEMQPTHSHTITLHPPTANTSASLPTATLSNAPPTSTTESSSDSFHSTIALWNFRLVIIFVYFMILTLIAAIILEIAIGNLWRVIMYIIYIVFIIVPILLYLRFAKSSLQAKHRAMLFVLPTIVYILYLIIIVYTGGVGVPYCYLSGVVLVLVSSSLGGSRWGLAWGTLVILTMLAVQIARWKGFTFVESFSPSFMELVFFPSTLILFLFASALVLVQHRVRCRIVDVVEDAYTRLGEVAGRERHAARIKEMFIQNLSHELRTPLNSVLGMLSLTLDDSQQLNPDTATNLMIAQESAEDLLILLNNLLDVSKIEAGRGLHVQFQPFSLHNCLEKCLLKYSHQAFNKNIEFILDLSPSLPSISCYSDPLRIQQVLNHILSNAVKFCERGEILVRIGVQQRRKHMVLDVSVSDTGPGIDPAVAHHVFSPFSSASHHVSTRKYGGSGLGLSICAFLIRLFHGQISITSRANQGTTVQFTMQLELLDAVNSRKFELQHAASLSGATTPLPAHIDTPTSAGTPNYFPSVPHLTPSQQHKHCDTAVEQLPTLHSILVDSLPCATAPAPLLASSLNTDCLSSSAPSSSHHSPTTSRPLLRPQNTVGALPASINSGTMLLKQLSFSNVVAQSPCNAIQLPSSLHFILLVANSTISQLLEKLVRQWVDDNQNELSKSTTDQPSNDPSLLKQGETAIKSPSLSFTVVSPINNTVDSIHALLTGSHAVIADDSPASITLLQSSLTLPPSIYLHSVARAIPSLASRSPPTQIISKPVLYIDIRTALSSMFAVKEKDVAAMPRVFPAPTPLLSLRKFGAEYLSPFASRRFLTSTVNRRPSNLSASPYAVSRVVSSSSLPKIPVIDELPFSVLPVSSSTSSETGALPEFEFFTPKHHVFHPEIEDILSNNIISTDSTTGNVSTSNSGFNTRRNSIGLNILSADKIVQEIENEKKNKEKEQINTPANQENSVHLHVQVDSGSPEADITDVFFHDASPSSIHASSPTSAAVSSSVSNSSALLPSADNTSTITATGADASFPVSPIVPTVHLSPSLRVSADSISTLPIQVDASHTPSLDHDFDRRDRATLLDTRPSLPHSSSDSFVLQQHHQHSMSPASLPKAPTLGSLTRTISGNANAINNSNNHDGNTSANGSSTTSSGSGRSSKNLLPYRSLPRNSPRHNSSRSGSLLFAGQHESLTADEIDRTHLFNPVIPYISPAATPSRSPTASAFSTPSNTVSTLIRPNLSPGTSAFKIAPTSTVPSQSATSSVSASTSASSASTTPLVLSDSAPFILIVDDNDVNLKVASRMCQRLGFRAVTCGGGYEAIQFLRNIIKYDNSTDGAKESFEKEKEKEKEKETYNHHAYVPFIDHTSASVPNTPLHSTFRSSFQREALSHLSTPVTSNSPSFFPSSNGIINTPLSVSSTPSSSSSSGSTPALSPTQSLTTSSLILSSTLFPPSLLACIMMDISMPDLDGLQTTQLIREEFTLGTPIFAVTANMASPDEVDGWYRAGMQGLVPKPIKADLLMEAIRAHVAAALIPKQSVPLRHRANAQRIPSNPLSSSSRSHTSTAAPGIFGQKQESLIALTIQDGANHSNSASVNESDHADVAMNKVDEQSLNNSTTQLNQQPVPQDAHIIT